MADPQHVDKAPEASHLPQVQVGEQKISDMSAPVILTESVALQEQSNVDMISHDRHAGPTDNTTEHEREETLCTQSTSMVKQDDPDVVETSTQHLVTTEGAPILSTASLLNESDEPLVRAGKVSTSGSIDNLEKPVEPVLKEGAPGSTQAVIDTAEASSLGPNPGTEKSEPTSKPFNVDEPRDSKTEGSHVNVHAPVGYGERKAAPEPQSVEPHAFTTTSAPLKNESTMKNEQEATKNSVVTIQHNIETTTHESRSGLGGLIGAFGNMSKPMMALTLLVGIGGIVTWAYFFSQFLRIPGLEDQVDRLEKEVDVLEAQVELLTMEIDRLTLQVDRLSTEVDRLEEENDRFEQLNANLTAANEVFAGLIDELEQSNDDFEAENNRLNASVTELSRQNDILKASNEEFRNLTEQLNATNMALSDEVEDLREINANLTTTNKLFVEQNLALRNETEFLRNLTAELNETVSLLDSQVLTLQGEKEELQVLVDDLSTIVSFLEEEALDGEETYQELASFLSEQIIANRALLLGVTESTYSQTLTTWDCNLFSTFAGDPFIIDLDSPIGATDYPVVIYEVDTLALIPLCLDQSDLELYLATEVVQDGIVPPVDMTVNELVSGVNMYITLSFDYYFPDASYGGNGLTQEDWALAEYDCKKLQANQTFTFL